MDSSFRYLSNHSYLSMIAYKINQLKALNCFP